MKLAAAAHRELQAFFREYLKDEGFRLPVIYFYAGKLTGILTNLIGVHGITFGRHIFIKPSLVSLNRDGQPQLSKNLAAHEIVHTLQYRREGCVKFLSQYLKDYRQNLRKFEKRDASARQSAYLEIPSEIEARAIAAQFVEWRKTTGNEKWKMENGEC